MSSNDINSAIPIQFANLTSLSVLDLSGCSLHGLLPYLPQLKELGVSDNNDLHTDLTSMFEHRWPNLQILDISSNEMTGPIPSSISNAPQLVSLSAAWCSIQGSLPSSIYNLSRLQHLDLYDSKITSYIHSSISNLKELNYLDLSFNNIQGPIPDSICELFPLRHLKLGSNNITGTIPSCITKLQHLRSFDVSENSITGTVSLISLINELSLTLDLSSNNLTVVTDQHLYPSKFKLRSLRLESLNMQGFIPTSICNLTRLKYLGLSSNNLTGAIPSCISKLKNLNILDLSKNRLSGHLPPLPPSVNNLYLSNNELSGSIPSSICSQKPRNTKWDHIIPILLLQNDLIINLSCNKLSGIIPYSIGYCTNLIILDISNNNLTGNVPNELQHTNLVYLALSDNNLNGPFPMLTQNLFSLRVLNLRNNKFEGNIPVGLLGSLERLAVLSLRSNRFNGSIPKDIIHLQELRILDLSLNNFSGPIPLKLGNLTTLTSKLFISTKGIIVPLSLDLYQSYTMQYQVSMKGTMAQFAAPDIYSLGIDLSCNFLSGNIPEEIGLLQGLAILNLSNNLFSGSIPPSVGNMSSLESLDLSSNRLSGHIPQSLTEIDTLGYISLSRNNLSGRIPRGNHFDTLSVNGSAFVRNDLLCGFPLEKVCGGDSNVDTGDTCPSSKVEEDDQEDGKEKLLLYAIVAMGCAVGFWGLFFVLLLNKQNWWFGYWRNIDSLAVNIVERCIQ